MQEVVQQTIQSYERIHGRGIPEATIQDDLRKPPQFFRWSNGKFHRLPEDFVLTCIGTSDVGDVVKTALQGFLRWNMDDCCLGICPIRQCDPSDFSKKNQRKRFSDWCTLFKGWDVLLLKQGGQPLVGPSRRNAMMEDWIAEYNKIFAIHCTLIKFWHTSKAKRKKMQKNPASYQTLKISTTLHDLRNVTSSIKRYSRFFRAFRGMLRIQRMYHRRNVVDVSWYGPLPLYYDASRYVTA